MKKVFAGVMAALGLALLAGCSDISTSSESKEYGSITVSSGDGSSARYLDSSEITTATVRVWYGKDQSVSASGNISLTNGSGSATVNNIPVGKNRVVEVVGYKDSACTVEGKRLYYVMDVNTGSGNSCTIKDGETSAKGKAYLALLNAGTDVTGLSITGFTSGKGSDYFDASSFATAYKSNSSTSPAGYYTAAGTVNLSTISNASGYTVWIDDPISSKLSISDNTTTSSSISNVAPGTWNVYVNNGSTTTKAGTVTVANGAGTFSTLIGKNPLDGKTVIFVKASNAGKIYLWGNTTETKYAGEYPGSALTSVPSGYMNDSTGWLCYDFTSTYNNEQINFILLNSSSNKLTGDVKTSKTATFWYEYADGGSNDKFYDADPTKPAVDTDVTLSDIKVNGVSIGASATAYTIGKNVTSAAVTATATSSSAVVTVSGTSEIASGSSSTFTISVTNNGASATYTLTVSRAAANDVSLSAISVNSKSATISGTTATCSIKGTDDSLSITSITATPVDSDATVTYSATTGTVADGKSTAFTITVTNGTASASYTLTVSYTKQSASTSSYYWTNKNGYGKEKTITIDGNASDWTEDMKIVQNMANDDPRVYCDSSMHEMPLDLYALYAAYDDDNLYMMFEYTNVQDIVSPENGDPMSNDITSANLPIHMAFNTGAANHGNGVMDAAGSTLWNSGITWDMDGGIDTVITNSTKFCNGNWIYRVGSDGYLAEASGSMGESVATYANGNNRVGTGTGSKTGIKWARGQGIASTKIYGIKAVQSYNGRVAGDTLAATDADVVEFNSLGHDSSTYDVCYEVAIPYKNLNITKSDITSKGIGVSVILTMGVSAMDCLPWDSSMIDNAAEPYTLDTSTSHEKEDADSITSALARIGK